MSCITSRNLNVETVKIITPLNPKYAVYVIPPCIPIIQELQRESPKYLAQTKYSITFNIFVESGEVGFRKRPPKFVNVFPNIWIARSAARPGRSTFSVSKGPCLFNQFRVTSTPSLTRTRDFYRSPIASRQRNRRVGSRFLAPETFRQFICNDNAEIKSRTSGY